MSRRTAVVGLAVALACLCTRAASAEPQLPPSRTDLSQSPPLLSVPYVPQSEALCGGAALAMVMRYWRDAPVHAEDFASLVDDSAEGIRLRDLAAAARGRGMQALPFAGRAQDVRDHLRHGRPVIALIEDRPGRHHYVVVMAYTDERVAFHDPASGPFRIVDLTEFERAWAVTGNTSLLVLPGTTADSDAGALVEADTRDAERSACHVPVDQAIALARGGQLPEAERLLTMSAELCRGDAAPRRELAGIRFVQQRWSDAADLAAQAVDRDATDMHAWELLAASRFLDEDADGALAAWNRRQEPRVDLARVDGLDRTRYDVVAGILDLPPHTMLTASKLQRAARRVAALPAVRSSRVEFSPRAAGTAMVDVAVVERPLFERGWTSLAAAGVRAAIEREARFDLASPTGNGELWTVSGRWWATRPRVALALTTPRVWRWSGVWRIDGSWERQTYAATTADGLAFVSERRHAAVTYGDWVTGTTRWELTSALDHWGDRGRQVAAGAALDQRALDDHLALRVEGAFWPASRSAQAFATAAVTTAWRSTRASPSRWTARGGVSMATQRAPLDLWAGAGTGQVHPALLRAHPLLEDGVVTMQGLGRRLVHATVEFERPLIAPAGVDAVARRGAGALALYRSLANVKWAAFADTARVFRGLSGDRPMHVDVGIGIRVQLATAPAALRIDVARGMRDGRLVASAAWQLAWPGW